MNPVKNIIKHLWFSLRDLFIPESPSERRENSLVILRLDAIGDYILFRNFLEIIRKSNKYRNHHITLIGNNIWKPIAEKLDNQFVDRFIWVELKGFNKSFSIRKKTLMQIEDTTYDVLFHPTFSRDYYVSEVIAKRINAITKIASVGDASNSSKWQKALSDKIYDDLLPDNLSVLFEFFKNKDLVGKFLGQPVALTKPIISKSLLPPYTDIPDDYIVLFIGGGADFRKWPVTHWIRLIKWLLDQYDSDIIIAGGPTDKAAGDLIKEHFKSSKRIVNRCGKTSLNQLITLISHAKWMVSNETSAPHIAVLVDTPVIVISNGNHYGRFTPYPNDVAPEYKAVYPPEIENENNVNVLIKQFAKGSDLSINKVKPGSVISKIKKLQG